MTVRSEIVLYMEYSPSGVTNGGSIFEKIAVIVTAVIRESAIAAKLLFTALLINKGAIKKVRL